MSTDMQSAGDNGAAGNPRAGTETAARAAHDFVDRVADIAGQSEEKLRRAGAGAEESVRHSIEVARRKSDTAKTSVTDFVQEHPFAALGIAFGTGVLLSYLTRGSRAGRDDDSA